MIKFAAAAMCFETFSPANDSRPFFPIGMDPNNGTTLIASSSNDLGAAGYAAINVFIYYC